MSDAEQKLSLIRLHFLKEREREKINAFKVSECLYIKKCILWNLATAITTSKFKFSKKFITVMAFTYSKVEQFLMTKWTKQD